MCEQFKESKMKPKKKIRFGRLSIALILFMGVFFAGDNLRRQVVIPDSKIVVKGDFKENVTGAASSEENTASLAAAAVTETQPASAENVGFLQINLTNTDISRGILTPAVEGKPLECLDSNKMVALADVMNDCYSLYSEDIQLNSDAAEALNLMMNDYNVATGLSDFVVYGTDSGDNSAGTVCPIKFAESSLGTTVDLAITGSAGNIIDYDGADEEGWVIENCAKYGFIVRYPSGKSEKTGTAYCPWHLRYVGAANAQMMLQKGLCLEEYLDFLKSYSYDSPLEIELEGSDEVVYYVAASGDSTSAYVPISGGYTVSGNNGDGFIVTSFK